MQLSDFDFDLPQQLIASYPLANRSDSRLLHLDRRSGQVVHRQFSNLTQLLDPRDLMVFNDTRVLPARLLGRKSSGGQVEILVTRVLDHTTALAMVRSSKPARVGSVIHVEAASGDPEAIEVIAAEQDLLKLRFGEPGVMTVLERCGHIPLPPYVGRADVELDRDRYQTVYARRAGAVAAPTAGLHFDTQMLARIEGMGIDCGFVTLHVGPGTFQPVRVARIEEHRMHAEYAEVSSELCDQVTACRQRNGRIFAVGTTSVRCLETASASGEIAPFRGETDLFIYPGYQFRSTDALLTNFHLPGSTLIMLVSAFCGLKELKLAYQEAIEQQYRFFSYGDAMVIS